MILKNKEKESVKMNYNLIMKEQIEKFTSPQTLLLHACCAPCSSAVLEKLKNIFKITVYFYNPNITDKEEYEKRYLELERFIKEFDSNINLIKEEFSPTTFFEMSKGLEQEPERGRRCYKCYNLRLQKTALIAEEKNFDFFTTTLSLSPYKNSNWINEIGAKLDKTYNSNFLYNDFKKEKGYQRSIELSKQYNLYRQDYCGCIYSKKS